MLTTCWQKMHVMHAAYSYGARAKWRWLAGRLFMCVRVSALSVIKLQIEHK